MIKDKYIHESSCPKDRTMKVTSGVLLYITLNYK